MCVRKSREVSLQISDDSTFAFVTVSEFEFQHRKYLFSSQYSKDI